MERPCHFVAQFDGKVFALEPAALAFSAGRGVHVRLDPFPDRIGGGLGIVMLECFENAGEAVCVCDRSSAGIRILYCESLLRAAIQEHFAGFI